VSVTQIYRGEFGEGAAEVNKDGDEIQGHKD
jgi:hypothetical protein